MRFMARSRLCGMFWFLRRNGKPPKRSIGSTTDPAKLFHSSYTEAGDECRQ